MFNFCEKPRLISSYSTSDTKKNLEDGGCKGGILADTLFPYKGNK